MNPSEAAQALFRYNFERDFKVANMSPFAPPTILRTPTSFFPHPDGFYSTGECNGVEKSYYSRNKGRIDNVYQALAEAFNAQLNRPIHSRDAEKFASDLKRLWGRDIVVIDRTDGLLARAGDVPSLHVFVEKRPNPRGFNYHVDGYMVLSAE